MNQSWPLNLRLPKSETFKRLSKYGYKTKGTNLEEIFLLLPPYKMDWAIYFCCMCNQIIERLRQYGSCLIKFQETGEITVSLTTILRLILLLEERFQISML